MWRAVAGRTGPAGGWGMVGARSVAGRVACQEKGAGWEAAVVDAATGAALRAATRAAEGDDLRDADLAALVRSAARPGLVARVRRYVESLKAPPVVQAASPERPATRPGAR